MKQNNFKTIYEVRSGSHLYGTNNINSDEDFRGICVVTISQMIDPFENFEQQIETKETDRVIYNIQKFFPLCADANPNILELLFADEKNIVVMSEDGEYLLDNRHLFLSQKIRKTFMGYAEAQLKRIKLHRGYLLNPPKGKPERKDFGLPESPFFGNEKMNSVIHAPEETISPQWREYVLKEKQYRSASEDWQKYQQWKQNRNPKRFEIEKKYNYDCYVEDTEFLTKKGWKKYKEIDSTDLLGTINPKSKTLEFQKIKSRTSYFHSGNVYKLKTQSTQCIVTENHNMFVSPISRKKSNNFNTEYDEKTSDWKLLPVGELVDGHKSFFHVLSRPKNKNKDYPVSDEYLTLMGLYVSEGSLIKNSKKDLKGVSISQLENPNKILCHIEKIEKYYNIKKYIFFRRNRNQITYNIYNENLAEKIRKDCGEYSKEKTLPEWILNLSKRQSNILLKSLLSGDGTNRKTSQIYYTSSKNLSNWVNILSILCGFSSKVWRYVYADKNEIFQVYISDNYPEYERAIFKEKSNGSGSIEKLKYSGDVVCFEVENGILATRINGEVSYNGNCKHANHLFRLLFEGQELLQTCNLNFPLKSAPFLRAVLNGDFTYDQLMNAFETQKIEFDKCESILPNKPNLDKLKEVYYNIVYNQ